MNFDFTFSSLTLLLAGISFLSFLLLTTVYRGFITRVARLRADQADSDISSSSLPAVSVVVYATPDCDGLTETLRMILKQDYPTEFDVIVVNDGGSEDVKDIVNLLNNSYKNLYITFVPDQAHSLSRRKLAMTLGVKSARHDCVVFTNGGVSIDSTRWLASMTAAFTADKKIVIGYCAMKPGNDNSGMRAFDRVATATTYLGSAIGGAPYRANNNNLVLSKKMFLENKGFSRSLNLHGGDDDIFISEIADGNNTEVVLSDDTILYFETANPSKYHRLEKASHIFTGRHLHKPGQMMMSFGSWCRTAGVATGIAASILSLPSLVMSIWVLVTFIASWIIMAMAWGKTARALGEKMNAHLAPLYSFYRPVYNFYYKIVSFATRRRNFTWS